MRAHNGMRPQDIVILLAIHLREDMPFQNKELAAGLLISPAEITHSLHRSEIAGLWDPQAGMIDRKSLMKFLQYGIRHVFPVRPGTLVSGVPTAYSYRLVKNAFKGLPSYVWPDPNGYQKGLAIEPLYANQVAAAKEDDLLYEILALIDLLRIGGARESAIALPHLIERVR